MENTAKVTKIDKNLLITLWNEGIPASEIAKRLNTTAGTVYIYARSLSECIKPKPRKKRPRYRFNKALIEKLLNAGVSVSDIAKQVNCSEQTVYRYKKQMHDYIPKMKESCIDRQLFIKLWNDANVRQIDIAKKFKIAVITVQKYGRKFPECIKPKPYVGKANKPSAQTPQIAFDKTLFIKMWNEGKSKTSIAEYFNISVSTVQSYGKEIPECINPKPRKDKIDEALLIKLWNEGMSGNCIARQLNTTKNVIYSRVKSIPECHPRQKKEFDEKLFKELWNSGVAAADIAKQFNITIASVYARSRAIDGRVKRKGRVAKIDKDLLIKLWNEWVPIDEIAKQLNTTKNTVRSYIRIFPECIKRGYRRVKIDEPLLIKLWNAGVPVVDIAKQLNTTTCTVYSCVKKIPECTLRCRKHIDKELFKKMWNDGISTHEIAEKFGISVKNAYKYATRIPGCVERGPRKEKE